MNRFGQDIPRRFPGDDPRGSRPARQDDIAGVGTGSLDLDCLHAKPPAGLARFVGPGCGLGASSPGPVTTMRSPMLDGAARPSCLTIQYPRGDGKPAAGSPARDARSAVTRVPGNQSPRSSGLPVMSIAAIVRANGVSDLPLMEFERDFVPDMMGAFEKKQGASEPGSPRLLLGGITRSGHYSHYYHYSHYSHGSHAQTRCRAHGSAGTAPCR